MRVQGGTWEHASKVSKSFDYYPAHSGRISSSILLTVASELILCKQHSEIINEHFKGKIMIMTVTSKQRQPLRRAPGKQISQNPQPCHNELSTKFQTVVK